ncbi:MAG TPA: 3-phosphoshikimate 1-carboxyvinyltransferase [Casimicrobiaceae bacterium]|nr:3-phosphoshikimate 1-carboxyvinyltransferase [Casimicrobiaceae bacterium]
MGSASAAPAYLDLAPVARAAGTVALPGSKSISNRTLLLASLASGDTLVRGLLDADDVERMLDALTTLGIGVEQLPASRDYRVRGSSGRIPVESAKLFLGNAGTAFRPLTAVLALAGGDYELSGVPRMHKRPIGDLVDALRALGGEIDYLGNTGFPPLAIRSNRAAARARDRVSVRGSVSSQFTSALLMALPTLATRLQRPITVDIEGELISKPYVAITTNLMRRFGVAVAQDGWRSFTVPGSARFESPGAIRVEGDASTASYFLAAGALGGGPVRVTGVGRASIQGDVGFADVLERMGATVRRGDDWIEAAAGPQPLSGIDVDCVAIPDAAMTLAVVALFARGPTTLTGIASWRVKETDRIAAMATELAKLGARVEASDDRMTIVAPPRLEPATIDTYDDHRIAMCFALAALGGVAVRINDPDCVRKTFPDFFATLRAIAS